MLRLQTHSASQSTAARVSSSHRQQRFARAHAHAASIDTNARLALLQRLGLRGAALERALKRHPALLTHDEASLCASADWLATETHTWAELAGECRAGSCAASPAELLAAAPGVLLADVNTQLAPAARFLRRHVVRHAAAAPRRTQAQST